jgi:hypothetical protein
MGSCHMQRDPNNNICKKNINDRSTQKLMCLTGELENLGPLELVNRSANKSRTNQQHHFYLFIYFWLGDHMVESMYIN